MTKQDLINLLASSTNASCTDRFSKRANRFSKDKLSEFVKYLEKNTTDTDKKFVKMLIIG